MVHCPFRRLWPEQNEGVFDGVARIPYMDLLNDNSYIDPFVLQSMKKFGFFYVVDVPEYSASLEQDYMKQFYDLDEDVKDELAIRRHNPANKNAYRGNYQITR